jgi:hypothetical protein
VSRIFLGHSSANEAEAIAVHDWLIEQGWNDAFLDLEPERKIEARLRRGLPNRNLCVHTVLRRGWSYSARQGGNFPLGVGCFSSSCWGGNHCSRQDGKFSLAGAGCRHLALDIEERSARLVLPSGLLRASAEP